MQFVSSASILYQLSLDSEEFEFEREDSYSCPVCSLSHEPLSCFTALSDTQGNFLLNGNFVVSMAKKEINIQGAVFEYSGSNNSIERINSTDRLEAELVLQVT